MLVLFSKRCETGKPISIRIVKPKIVYAQPSKNRNSYARLFFSRHLIAVQDILQRLTGYGKGGPVSERAWCAGKNRSINHPQILDAMDPEFGVNASIVCAGAAHAAAGYSMVAERVVHDTLPHIGELRQDDFVVEASIGCGVKKDLRSLGKSIKITVAILGEKVKVDSRCDTRVPRPKLNGT